MARWIVFGLFLIVSILIGVFIGSEIPMSVQIKHITHFLTISGIILGVSGAWLSLAVGLENRIQENKAFLSDTRNLWIAIYWSLGAVVFSSLSVIGKPYFDILLNNSQGSPAFKVGLLRGVFSTLSVFFLLGEVLALFLVISPANTAETLKKQNASIDKRKQNKFRARKSTKN